MTSNADRLLHQSLLYRVLATAYAYPDQEFQEALASGAFSTALRVGATRLADARLSEQADRLDQIIQTLPASSLRLQEEYTALFLRKVPCSLYASRYLVPSALFRPRVLTEVAGYYRALGLGPAAERPELPDHLGAELEFLGLAAAQEYAAHQQCDIETADRVREVRERFCSEHVALWVPLLRERLAKHARLAFYPAVTDVVLALLAVDQPVLATAGGSTTVASLDGNPMEGGDETGSSFECGVVAG
jgi:DMSO reductase family type II enzyme chaperone